MLTPSRPSTPERPAEQVIGAICRKLGLEATVVNSRHSITDATATARTLLAGDPRPTAVFCLSDSIACGVYAAAAELGLSIPGDVSVAGYDDHPIATVLAPTLTTVMWGMEDLAKSASSLLAAAVEGKPRRGARARVRVEPVLVAARVNRRAAVERPIVRPPRPCKPALERGTIGFRGGCCILYTA